MRPASSFFLGSFFLGSFFGLFFRLSISTGPFLFSGSLGCSFSAMVSHESSDHVHALFPTPSPLLAIEFRFLPQLLTPGVAEPDFAPTIEGEALSAPHPGSDDL